MNVGGEIIARRRENRCNCRIKGLDYAASAAIDDMTGKKRRKCGIGFQMGNRCWRDKPLGGKMQTAL